MNYSSKYKYISVDIKLSSYTNEYEYRGYYYPNNIYSIYAVDAHTYLNSKIRSKYENYLLDQFNIHLIKYGSILYQELLK